MTMVQHAHVFFSSAGEEATRGSEGTDGAARVTVASEGVGADEEGPASEDAAPLPAEAEAALPAGDGWDDRLLPPTARSPSWEAIASAEEPAAAMAAGTGSPATPAAAAAGLRRLVILEMIGKRCG